MNRFLKNCVATLAIGGAIIAAIPAEAQRGGYRGGSGSHYGGGSYRGGGSAYRGNGGVYRGNTSRVYRDYRGPRGYVAPRYVDRSYSRYSRYYGPRYRGGYYGSPYGYGYYDDGAALAAGVVGLAVGAAIAADRDRYYDDDYGYGDYDYEY
ncbi:hypothetical protein [Sphingomonas sp.]|uniref:hypothetical protein n=1 Tax=Sphingomonas sp. TaxID=28214 RepID=UPI002C9FDFF7|nr:hypothetical protein [Sphingomonas sp.]HWK36486.1 hypothetical protein [Sphingomonas sp.]